jgi:ketosteroid isomerase-like protein
MSEEDELLKLDREWNEAYPRLDAAALERIIADDWAGIDGAGLRVAKRQLIERVLDAAHFPTSHAFDEITLRLFGGAAVVTGRLSFDAPDDDGHSVRVSQRYTRVYAKRGGRWQAVSTQVTVVKDDEG